MTAERVRGWEGVDGWAKRWMDWGWKSSVSRASEYPPLAAMVNDFYPSRLTTPSVHASSAQENQFLRHSFPIFLSCFCHVCILICISLSLPLSLYVSVCIFCMLPLYVQNCLNVTLLEDLSDFWGIYFLLFTLSLLLQYRYLPPYLQLLAILLSVLVSFYVSF